MAPTKDKVVVSFVQAKSQLNLNWTEANRTENTRKVVEEACSHGVSDIEAFAELCSHFLTVDQFKMLSFQFNITISDLTGIPLKDICSDCRQTYVYEEEKGKSGGVKYTFNQLRDLFGQPHCEEPASPEAEDLFSLLAAIYAGGGSLVKLSCSKEGYKEECKYLKQVDNVVQKNND
jgi:hypothetical protein